MTRSGSTSLQLARSTLIRLSDTARTIRCDAGSLWITQDGNPRDIVLAPGQQFRRDSRAGTIVYALEPARLTLQHDPAPAARAAPVRAAPRRVLAPE